MLAAEHLQDALILAAELMARPEVEGLHLTPWCRDDGVHVIGIGSTHWPSGRAVCAGDRETTRGEALDMCMRRLQVEHLGLVLRLCPQLDTPRRLAAMLSYADSSLRSVLENCGMRHAIRARNWGAAAVELRARTRDGGRMTGREVPGHAIRRAIEAEHLT